MVKLLQLNSCLLQKDASPLVSPFLKSCLLRVIIFDSRLWEGTSVCVNVVAFEQDESQRILIFDKINKTLPLNLKAKHFQSCINISQCVLEGNMFVTGATCQALFLLGSSFFQKCDQLIHIKVKSAT